GERAVALPLGHQEVAQAPLVDGRETHRAIGGAEQRIEEAGQRLIAGALLLVLAAVVEGDDLTAAIAQAAAVARPRRLLGARIAGRCLQLLDKGRLAVAGV